MNVQFAPESDKLIDPEFQLGAQLRWANANRNVRFYLAARGDELFQRRVGELVAFLRRTGVTPEQILRGDEMRRNDENRVVVIATCADD